MLLKGTKNENMACLTSGTEILLRCKAQPQQEYITKEKKRERTVSWVYPCLCHEYSGNEAM